MKDEIIITMVRHGECYDNLDKRYCSKDSELTKKGIEEITRAKEKLNCYKFDKVYHSSLKRTCQTKDILAVDSLLEERIRESDFGIFTGKTFDEIKSRYPKESKAWINDYINYRIPGGESLQDTYNRVNDFIYSLKADSLLISHEGIIKLVLSSILDDIKCFYSFKISFASFSQVIIAKDYKYISIVNERC